MAPTTRLLPAAALALLLTPLVAQEPVFGTDEARIRWVDGRPMLKATLRAGDKVYYCHLLLDLSTERPLFLHRNAAGSLRANACDVECGGLTLREVEFAADRDTWLEGLTSAHATALQQVPVAGIVGLGAFGERDVILDGPAGVLRVRPPTAAGTPPPPAGAALRVVPLLGSYDKGLQVAAEFAGDAAGNVVLHSRDPFSWLDPDLCRRAGERDGVLSKALLGGTFEAAAWTPFRPLRSPGAAAGGLGGAVLQQLVLHLQPLAQRLVVTWPAPPQYPTVEAEFQRAAFGGKDPARLQEFVASHGDAPQAAEAAAAWLERLLEQDGDLEALAQAGLAVVRTAPANGRATAALDVLEQLPNSRDAFAARAAVAEAGLAEARSDEDGTAGHRLRLELGTQLRLLGDLPAARRHLLSAVFGMPTSGAANLQLGHWHRDRGEVDAALNRYFLALLDMKDFGQPAYVEFAKLFAGRTPGEAALLAELADRADGRLPAFQPIPRDPASVVRTGRTVLVELFTGAMCPPCVAADVAADALGQLYGPDEVVVVQWHLPIPAPEPLVSPAALQRAEALGVDSTPTMVFGGGERLSGGGKVDAAPDLFRRCREAIDPLLAKTPEATIDGAVQPGAGRMGVRAEVRPAAGAAADGWRLHALLVETEAAFPGANGMLFHHAVVRSAFTPPTGVPIGRPLEVELSLAEVGAELDAQVRELETRREFLVRPVQPAPERLAVVLYVMDRQGRVVQAKLLSAAGGPR